MGLKKYLSVEERGPIVYAAGAVIIALLFIFTIAVFGRHGSSASKTTNPYTQSTFSIVPKVPSTAPDGSVEVPTTYQLPTGAAWTVEQLNARYTQQGSKLSPEAYNAAVDVAKAFSMADATGQGADKFADYYSNGRSNVPWASAYNFQFATAMATAQPDLIKTLVYWSGTAIRGNTPLTQVTNTIYLHVNGETLTVVPPDQIEGAGLEQSGFDTQIING